MIPAQIVAPTIEKRGEAVDETHGITIAGPKDAANVPVGAIQPSDETRTAEEATGKDNKLTVHGTIEQRTMAAPILTTEPAIEKLGGATPQVDGITMTAPNDAQDVPVGTIQPSNKTPNVASSIRHDDKLRLDAPIEQSTMSAQTIASAPAIERLD
jgi:hypothetical protein